ncbi:bacteriocin [Staphylococcus rostri]|nr:bacteriocin [Staphylococcus rostri]
MKTLNVSELKQVNGGDFFKNFSKIIHDYGSVLRPSGRKSNNRK